MSGRDPRAEKLPPWGTLPAGQRSDIVHAVWRGRACVNPTDARLAIRYARTAQRIMVLPIAVVFLTPPLLAWMSPAFLVLLLVQAIGSMFALRRSIRANSVSLTQATGGNTEGGPT